MIVSLATAFSLTLVSVSFQQYRYLKLQITNIPGKYVLTLPAVVIISSRLSDLYRFYDSDPLGGQVLMWYAPVALLFALQ